MRYFINFSLLKQNSNFRVLFLCQLMSMFGSMIMSVALPYEIYHATHSTLMVGLLSFFQLIPLLFTGLIGGVFADRYNRVTLIAISQLIFTAASLLLAWNTFIITTSSHILALFTIAILTSAVSGIQRPASQGLLQQLIEPKDFPQAGTLFSILLNTSAILGPALGGLLIAHFGLEMTYLINFFIFLLSLPILGLFRNLPKLIHQHHQSTWHSLKEGIRYAYSRQELLGSYFVDFTAMIFGMPNALFPAIAHSLGSPVLLGYLYSAPAVGALLISFFSGWITQINQYGKAIALTAVFWGVSIIFFGLTLSHPIWALLFLALAGAFDAMSGIFRMILWNNTIPHQLRGRLAGIEMISYLSGPKLGDAESGIVASLFSVTTSIISGGILCIIGVILCCRLLPKFYYYNNKATQAVDGSDLQEEIKAPPTTA